MSKDNQSVVKDIQATDLRSDGVISEGEEKKGPSVVVDQVQASSDSVKAAENATSQAPVPTVKGSPEAKQPITPDEADEAAKAAGKVTSKAPEPAPKQGYHEGIDGLLKTDKTLTEDFKAKAATIFEETVQARVDARVSQLEENFKVQLEEQSNALVLRLTEQVDSYLGYVTQTWMKDNSVAIEKGLRTEIAEQFIEGMKNLFKEHYIAVPEGKEDQVETLSKKVLQLEEQLNKVTKDNISLVTEAKNNRRAAIIAEAAKGLASTEVVKLNALVEGVAFETEEDFQKKLSTIKENAFRKMPKNSNPTETILTEETAEEANISPAMKLYSDAITRTVKSA